MTTYTGYITPQALDEIKALLGHMRQRMRRTITSLTNNPRPPESKALILNNATDDQVTDLTPEAALRPDETFDARRLRINRWRIIYTVMESERIVDVLAIRKRPPYDYGDLEALLTP